MPKADMTLEAPFINIEQIFKTLCFI